MEKLDFHVEPPRRAGRAPSRAASARRSPSAAPCTGTPRLVIMDEPTAALGVPEQLKVISLIKSLKAQGKGIIFISHNLRDIFEVADRIVVFRRGENAGERTPERDQQRRDRPADGREVAGSIPAALSGRRLFRRDSRLRQQYWPRRVSA